MIRDAVRAETRRAAGNRALRGGRESGCRPPRQRHSLKTGGRVGGLWAAGSDGLSNTSIALLQHRTDRIQCQNEFQRIIQEAESTKALLPAGRPVIFCVDRKRHTSYLACNCDRSFASRQQQVASESATL